MLCRAAVAAAREAQVLSFSVHVWPTKSHKVSVALRETPVLFLLLGFLVQRPKVSPEDEDHHNGQPIRRNADRVRISVTLTPGLWPDVRTGDITQLTESVDECDSDSALRRRMGERGANPRKEGRECGGRLRHQEPSGAPC